MIELMYCEVVNSPELLARFTESKPPTRIPSGRYDNWRTTSANVQAIVYNYLKAALNASSTKEIIQFTWERPVFKAFKYRRISGVVCRYHLELIRK